MTTLPPSPHPPVPYTLISFPHPAVMLVTLNRPAQLNAIPSAHHTAMAALWAWYDAQPELRCAVLTGAGRAFCAGADLREWDSSSSTPNGGGEAWLRAAGGFGGLSNRSGGKKPVIAAVNGLCLGGGMEMVINCDLVVADAQRARFGLPEVTRGVIALAGALPRLVRTVGRQRAAEMALLGRTGYTAQQMREWGLVNFVVDKEKGEGDVVEVAVKLAEEVARNSPDAVIVSREGLRLGWEGIGPDVATDVLGRGMYGRIDGGENMREGVKSFVEKRKPVWKDSKL
ncbi:ClpP/crotonase [Canariomyces notabilis]|uniref:ClpP/crotonase n=1 Tax=Canariomyces notabilis TaxID=2074819 RepID=A0AAN6QG70_9PEZI|nr:ClpP/crotonase [Canariomyces arenarius]